MWAARSQLTRLGWGVARRGRTPQGLIRFRCMHQGPEYVRNVAIIAHVDHGKTTLVDKLLRDTQGADPANERLMDALSLEKERGITIMSKATKVEYGDKVISIVDTPGHSDFGGEVERVLSMVDGVVLVVDATEGPMPQTKFVLMKAIEHRLKMVVVINKVDRPSSRVDEVEGEILDLFCALDAEDEQLEYPLLYASAREGWAVRDLAEPRENMRALLDSIVETVPPPCDASALDKPFTFEVNAIQTDTFVGRICLGRVRTGRVKVGDPMRAISREGAVLGEARVTKIYIQKGMTKSELSEAAAGDIVWIAGLEAGVSDTLADPSVEQPLPTRALDPPTISMTFAANDSPLAGKEGKFVTASHIKNRLFKEIENNVSIQLKPSPDPEAIEVHGRGELQMGILIEEMRRESYELCVAPPKVLTRKCKETGRELEPIEEVQIEVDAEYSGVVVERMTNRKGNLVDFKEHRGKNRLIFTAPTRGLLGFVTEIKTETRGTAVVNRLFKEYSDKVGAIEGLKRGKLISMDAGQSTAYALNMLEDRGHLFIHPGEAVYSGMIIGEHNRNADLEVNPTKAKKTTNVRSVQADEAIRLSPPVRRSLEELISYISSDEVLEITPTQIRLRKKELDPNKRKAGLRGTKR